MTEYPLVSKEHAMLAALAWGTARRNGVALILDVGPDGRPTASATLPVPGIKGDLTIRLIVEPPPTPAAGPPPVPAAGPTR